MAEDEIMKRIMDVDTEDAVACQILLKAMQQEYQRKNSEQTAALSTKEIVEFLHYAYLIKVTNCLMIW